MRTLLALAIVGFVFFGTLAAQERATPDPAAPNSNVGERIGESVDRGLNQLGEKLRRGWADIRKSVDELTVQGRVYGRLRWDKALATAPIEIAVQNENVVTLSGTVADEVARMSAVKLAQDTVGVGKVVDNLTVSSTAIGTAPAKTTTAPPVVPTVPPLTVPRR
jgi:hyperosmotically inducible periplasmic protein